MRKEIPRQTGDGRTPPYGEGTCCSTRICSSTSNSAAFACLSLRHARQSFEAARRLDGSKFDRPLVPLTGLSNIRTKTWNPGLGQQGLIKGQAKLKRGLRIAFDGRAFEQKSSGRDVTALQQILPKLDQGGDLLGIQWQEHGHRFGRPDLGL